MRSLKSCLILTALAGAPRRPGLWLGGLLLVLLAGCQNDVIEHYQVPKPPVYRLLGAIVPQANASWFFKLTGPDEAVLEHRPEFDRFLESVTFAGADKPPSWQLPKDWRQEPGDPMRFATLLLGPQDHPLELTVSRFESKSDDKTAALLANVNRWRTQMGIAKIDAERLAEVGRPREVHGVTFYVVELTGPKPGKTARGMAMPTERPAAPRREPEADKQPRLRYTTPPGWKELDVPGGMTVAAFQAGAGPEAVRVAVTTFARHGEMAKVGPNVERWRSQVGLPPGDKGQPGRDVTDVRVAGEPGTCVDLTGPTGQRLVAVMTTRGEQVWFFKMSGPAAAVGSEKAAFDAFIQSVRFE